MSFMQEEQLKTQKLEDHKTYCLAFGNTFATPPLNQLKTDVKLEIGSTDVIKRRSAEIKMDPRIDAILESGAVLQRYPNVVSKVVTDGHKTLIFNGVSTQLYDIYGVLALEGQLAIRNMGDTKQDHLFSPFCVLIVEQDTSRQEVFHKRVK